MHPIKFLYLDVGGVSLLDFSGNNKWMEMKASIGVNEDNIEHFESIWKKHESRMCIDRDIDSIIPEFKQIKGVALPEDYSMLNDFVERFEHNHSLWPVIEIAKQRYKIGLLTNMYPRMLDSIREKKLLPDIAWDAIVDSSVVGYQKPEPGIYKKAEEIASVLPEEIFFVDNSEQNVNEAVKRGWSAYLYNPVNTEESSKKLSFQLGLGI